MEGDEQHVNKNIQISVFENSEKKETRQFEHQGSFRLSVLFQELTHHNYFVTREPYPDLILLMRQTLYGHFVSWYASIGYHE